MKVECMEKEIQLMQEHLPSLRKIAGWTTEELGEKLGLAKQSITAIESKNENTTKLSQAQYIALRFLFETEAEENKNETLKMVLDALFRDTEKYEKSKKEIDSHITLLAGAAMTAGASSVVAATSLKVMASALLAPVAPIALVAGSTLTATLGVKLLKLGKK